jgi:hypothetical protein
MVLRIGKSQHWNWALRQVSFDRSNLIKSRHILNDPWVIVNLRTKFKMKTAAGRGKDKED